jgi:hypothetical protein
MNPDLFYINLFTALVFGAVTLLITLALSKYKRKPQLPSGFTPPLQSDDNQKTVYGSLDRSNPNADENSKLWRELVEIRFNLTTTQAERDNYRGLWEQSVQRGKDKAAEFANERNRFMDELNKVSSGFINERDAAQLFADSLREYLDRALALINIQNEQIQQLMPKPKGWNLKVYPRDENGRITTPTYTEINNPSTQS